MTRDPSAASRPVPGSGASGDVEVHRIAGFITMRLMHSVQLLAQPAEVEDALLPDFACKPDELALDFDHWRRCLETNGTPSLSAEQRDTLHALDERIDDVLHRELPPHESVLLTDPAWEPVRRAARDALSAFGWPLDRPPSYAHVYVGGRRGSSSGEAGRQKMPTSPDR